MSIINSQPLIGASGNQSTAYNLTRSLRFRSSASAFLNRTPSSAGNQQKFTLSTWLKRGQLSTFQNILSLPNSSTAFRLTDTNTLGMFFNNGNDGFFGTNAVFRDPSAWYHIVLAIDTTQATNTNRIKLYVNGVEQTFSSVSYPSQNYNTAFNTAVLHRIGQYQSSDYLDGYLAEYNLVDGQQLTPSDFGETDTATGVWKPKKYTGTYGTNGFYLKFDNLTSTSTLGNDSSGNSNTWTVNNISLTSGSTYDSMKDVPTLTDADTANYCVLNPLQTPATVKFANLGFAGGGDDWYPIVGTIGVSSGKWYWEVIYNANFTYGMTGIAPTTYVPTKGTYPGSTATSYGYHSSAGNKYNNGSASSYGASYTGGDVIGVALDLDAGTLTFYKNNTSQGTAFSSLTGSFVPAIAAYVDCTVNFGQQPFAYTPPSGFKALNTFNLPTPTIGATASTQANDYFDVSLWTGNGSTQSITNSGSMQPDFVWIKGRSTAWGHRLADAVRGVGKELFSNDTSAELTNNSGGYLTAFNSNGFSINSGAGVNTNNDTYVAWQWKANGAGSSNTAGSITSTVSANTTAGFSIVTFTTDGTTNTVGHGLGVAPKFIIVKCRNNTRDWYVYTNAIDGTWDYASLNTTAAFANSSYSAPTSTVFSISDNNGYTQVAYCFAEVAGYSKFGSYTGNGSTDGTFVFTGFRPKFLMVKRTDTTGNWIIDDAVRNTSNIVDLELYPSLSNAESSDPSYDFLSNGFKLRVTSANKNASGGTYVFMALAENPFKYSLAR